MLPTASTITYSCLLLSWLLASAHACAQDPEPLMRSNELFSLGKRQQAAGDIAAACSSFAESQQLQARPGTLLNLGLCHEQQGLLRQALSELREAHKLASDAGRQDRVTLAGAHIRSIEAKLARVQVRASGSTAFAAQLWVDGELTALSDEQRALIEPGPHTLEVEAPGFRRIEVQLAVADGSNVVLTLLPIAQPLAPAQVAAKAVDPPPTLTAKDAEPWPALRTASWIVAAVGISSSLVLGAIAIEQMGVVNDHCKAKRCDSTGVAAAARGGGLILGANIGLAVGAVGAVSWLLLPGGWWNAPSEHASTARGTYW